MAAAVDIRDAVVRWPAAPALGALVIVSAAIDVLRHGLAASLDGIQVSGVWLAGLTMAVVAARWTRRHPQQGVVAARLLVLAAAASAVPSVAGLARVAATAPDPVAAAWHAFVTVRSAPFFADVNAGGSYFALFAVAAAWLAVTARPPWPWLAPAAALIVALWLTGSRTAVASVIAVLPAAWLAVRRPGVRARVAAALGAAALLAGVVFAPPVHVPQASAGYATRVRWDMAKVALAIAVRHPVLGVGLGHFQRESVAFIPADVVAYFPPAAAGENAHNNFLQMLAELGLPGLAAFLWLLGTPLGACRRALRGGRAGPEAVALAAGVTAFLITCLAGHPLLSWHATLAFLLALGLVLGLAGETP